VLGLGLLRPALAGFTRFRSVGLCYSRVTGDKSGQSLVHLEQEPCRSVFNFPIRHGTPFQIGLDEQATDLTTWLYASQDKWAVRDALYPNVEDEFTHGRVHVAPLSSMQVDLLIPDPSIR
jgi:hypothetical protein